jgi:hypothetical protein
VLKKVFEVDPLVCPKCGGEMKVIAWITDRAKKADALCQCFSWQRDKREAAAAKGKKPPHLPPDDGGNLIVDYCKRLPGGAVARIRADFAGWCRNSVRAPHPVGDPDDLDDPSAEDRKRAIEQFLKDHPDGLPVPPKGNPDGTNLEWCWNLDDEVVTAMTLMGVPLRR